MNLLDLPDLALEEIFSYCLRSLDELKQCSSFIKDFIETHRRLKRPPIKTIDLKFYTEEYQMNQSFDFIPEDHAETLKSNIEKYLSSIHEIYENFHVL